MIANAAGGLLPALARELRDTFNQATVLPSYGTYCPPIHPRDQPTAEPDQLLTGPTHGGVAACCVPCVCQA